jgi:GxxExxY protein
MKYEDLTNLIIKAFYKVYNTLGYGFLEKVYENALYLELNAEGLNVKKQHPVNVLYKEYEVGSYFADLLVNDIIIVELKAQECLIKEHEVQLVNYLKATDKEVGFLLNFGKKPEIKRKIFDNDKK